jgi:hypothetical protein
MYFVGSKSSRLFVAPITSKLKGKRKFSKETKNGENSYFYFLNGSHTESGERKEIDSEGKKKEKGFDMSQTS